MDEVRSGYPTQSHLNNPFEFQMDQSSSDVAQLVGNQQYPQSNYNVGLTQTEGHTQRTNRHVTQPGGGQQNNSQPMRNPRQIQPEQQAHQPPLSGMFSRVWGWLTGWVRSPSQGSEPHIVGIESITKYREQYDSYGSDDEKRGELIRNMLLTIVEQVSEMKDAIGERQRTMNMVYQSAGENSKHLKGLQQENEILKSQLKETTAEVVKLQQQLIGTRAKMVINAEKRGVLPNRDRSANEKAIKDYFNQRFPAFADEYGSEATNARKEFTELFVECFEDACEYLAQKMAEAKGYETYVPEQLKDPDDLNAAVKDVHDAEVWVERSKNPQFWEIYKAVMELKSTMLLQTEMNLEDELKSKLREKFMTSLKTRKYKYLCQVKHHGEDIDSSTESKGKKQKDKHTHPDKKKSAPTTSSCHKTPKNGAMSEVNPHVSVLEGFVTTTIDKIVLMLCLPNPILPSTHLKSFNSDWVATDASEEHVHRSQLADQTITAYYSPILFTASAGTDGYRVFLKGNVKVKRH